MISIANGGETGIRTLGGLSPTTVFETAPFDRSGTSPRLDGQRGGGFSGDSSRVQGGLWGAACRLRHGHIDGRPGAAIDRAARCATPPHSHEFSCQISRLADLPDSTARWHWPRRGSLASNPVVSAAVRCAGFGAGYRQDAGDCSRPQGRGRSGCRWPARRTANTRRQPDHR